MHKYDMEDIIRREEVSQVDIFNAACRIYCSFGSSNFNRYNQSQADSDNLDKARKELLTKLSKPIDTHISGRDTLLYNYVPSINPEMVEDMYFGLQGLHREHEARLNSIRFNLEDIATKMNSERAQEYEQAYKGYEAKYNQLYNQYREYRNVAINEVSTLKIVVPYALQPVLDKLESIQKK